MAALRRERRATATARPDVERPRVPRLQGSKGEVTSRSYGVAYCPAADRVEVEIGPIRDADWWPSVHLRPAGVGQSRTGDGQVTRYAPKPTGWRP